METLYGIHWWIEDESDFRDCSGFTTLEQALQKAHTLGDSGKGYHGFIIYAYHAELIDKSFTENGKVYKWFEWEKIDDDFEELWDIDGQRI